MSLSQLSQRDAIALEIMKALLVQNNPAQSNKDTIVDAFELADEFLWMSRLSADDAKATPHTQAHNPNTHVAKTPEPTVTATLAASAPSENNRPSFQVFTPDHPRKK